MNVAIRTYVSIGFTSWGAQAEVAFYDSAGLFLAVSDDYPRPSTLSDPDDGDPPPTERLP